MKGEITSIRTEFINNEIHVVMKIEGIVTIGEHQEMVKTFEAYRQDGFEYRVKTDKKYTFIERVKL